MWVKTGIVPHILKGRTLNGKIIDIVDNEGKDSFTNMGSYSTGQLLM